LLGLAALFFWNIINWYFALPSSSSHALIGGYAGAAIAKSGFGVIIGSGWYKTLLFIVLAPAIGLFLGFLLRIITTRIEYKQKPAVVNKWSRASQLFSEALYSLGHGSNDAQKQWGSSPVFFLPGV
jgi:PiT family inorganic phosphate transporter